MPDYDLDAARQQRNGSTFTLAGRKWPIVDVAYGVVDEWLEQPTSEKAKERSAQMLDFICEHLDEGDRKPFREEVGRKENHVTLGDLTALSRILLEHDTDRPTVRPSSSQRGPAATQAGSEGGSRRQVVVPTG